MKKTLTMLLGLGAACAACCAVPLLGGAAGLWVGASALAAFGSALVACADELAPIGFTLLALAAIGIGGFLWNRWARRRAAAKSTLPCGCAPGRCG